MRLERVGKRYTFAGPWVVRDACVDAGPGQLVRVEGPNGSGKSTLLRIVAGVCAPNRGKVIGRPHTGFVPEKFPAALPFTANDYLAHLGRVYGLRGGALRRRADSLLDRFGLAAHAGLPIRRMSQGTCQKVAIAQALLADPGLLVLDEAWTGLDQAARRTLDDAVAESLATGATVVFVDHDPLRLAGRAHTHWRIEHGHVSVQAGPASGPAPTAAAPAGAVVIELTGYPDHGPPLKDLPGVLSVVAGGRAGAVAIRAEAGTSDAVLRRLLAVSDAVHIVGVRPAAGGGEPEQEHAR